MMQGGHLPCVLAHPAPYEGAFLVLSDCAFQKASDGPLFLKLPGGAAKKIELTHASKATGMAADPGAGTGLGCSLGACRT